MVILAFMIGAVIASLAAAPPAQPTPQRESGPSDMLALAHMRSCLRLAEAELAVAREQCSRVEHSVSDYDLARLEARVELARENLAQTERGADFGASIIGYVKLQARLAQRDLATAEQAQAADPSAVSAAQLEYLRSYAQLCGIRQEMVRSPVDALATLDHLHWETHRLSEEMLLLGRRVERLEETARQ